MKNCTIPAKKCREFSTSEDNQTSIDIRLYQGEHKLAKDNVFLGSFRITGIPPARCGAPRIEVAVGVDASGSVEVSTKDASTGKNLKILVTSGFRRLNDVL